MPVEDFIIYVYCCVEDVCRTIVTQPLRSRGFMPKLSDAELITMEIVGEFMGKDQDSGESLFLLKIFPGSCSKNQQKLRDR